MMTRTAEIARAAAICLGTVLCASTAASAPGNVPSPRTKFVLVEADWRPYDAIELPVRFTGSPCRGTVLCSVFFQTKQSQWFEAQRELKRNGSTCLWNLRLDESSPDWRCSNARRSYGRDVLRWVSCWGIKTFAPEVPVAEIELGKLRLIAPKPEKPAPLKIHDIRLPADPVIGRINPVQFRLQGFDGNPFSTSQILGELIWSSDGRKGKTPAYFRQDYVRIQHPGTGESIDSALGRPFWQVNWAPGLPGEYSLRVEIRTPGQRLGEDLGAVRVTAEPPREAAGTSEALWTDGTDGFPATNSAFRMFQFAQGQWTAADDLSCSNRYWNIRLDWTSRWGSYTGLGEFDQLNAWCFEQALRTCPGDVKMPILIFGQDELDNQGTFNWVDHPLNRQNGGKIERPSQMFQSKEAGQIVYDRARYLWARFGCYPAVSGLLILANWPDSTAVGWIRQLTSRLAAELSEVRVLSDNPEMAERTGTRALNLLDAWQTDFRLSSNTKILADQASRTVQATLTDGDGATIVSRRLLHWVGARVFSMEAFTRQGSDDWPTKLLCFLRTGPDTVFQSALTPLRPGEWNRVNFYLDRSELWTCLQNPARRLTEHDLMSIKELGLRFFKSPDSQMVSVQVRSPQLHGPYLVDHTRAAPAVNNLTVVPQDPVRYGKVEISFDLSKVYANPFDPDEVSVTGIFTCPGGKRIQVPGFYYQGYERRQDGESERLSATGNPRWKIRFAPMETGEHTCMVQVIDREGHEVKTLPQSFRVGPSESSGFVRISYRNPRYLAFDNGKLYYPIGHNICYPVDVLQPYPYEFKVPSGAGTYTLDRYLKRMNENGENWARIWMTSWGVGLEGHPEWSEFYGLGWYNLANAWRLDHIIETAEEKGIYIQLTLDHYSEFSQSWHLNPYSRQLGGPLRSADDFFEDANARKAYRNRLRYVVARWGYSTHLLAWELWGEVNLIPGYEARRHVVAQWHKEMARHIRQLDPWEHLVFTHCHNWQKGYNLWALNEINCVQGNGYIRPPNDSVNHVINFKRYISEVAEFNKPIFVAEYGGRSELGAPSADYLEAQLHSGLWASVVSSLGGAAMHWWWNFVDGRDAYFHYKPVSDFCRDIDRLNTAFEPVVPVVVSSNNVLKAVGMQAKNEAFVWVYHPDVFTTLQNIPIVSGASITFRGIEKGTYAVDYWDTYTGEIIRQGTAPLESEHTLMLPPVRRDLAIKLRAEGSGL